MKKILFIIMLFPLLLIGQSNDQNYIKTKTYKAKSTGTITNDDIQVSVSYLDGLGRPKQAIAVAAGGAGQDIVMPVFYDNLGRQTKQYLPFADPAGTIANSSQNYIDNTTLLSTQQNYYVTKYPTDVAGPDPQTYSGAIIEQSPLSRVTEQTFPGTQWAAGAHTVKTEYGTNSLTDPVYDFKVLFINNETDKPKIHLDGTLSNTQYYAAGSLYKTVSKDENWISTDGNNKTIHEYKDKQGRLLLKRQFNEGVQHDTYYVYDRFGNLAYVIPPQAFENSNFIIYNAFSFTIDQAILEKYSYIYKYDSRNRVIEKQVPGKGVDYIVYDKLDRPVLTQSANQRDASGNGLRWLFAKYDKFNRVVYTGEYTSTSTRSALQTSINSSLTISETKTTSLGSFTANGLQVYYTKAAFPIASLELFTVNYYDNYTFPLAGIAVPAATDYDTLTASVKILPVASVARVLDSSVTQWITTVMGYDAKGRLIWSKNNNAYYTTTNTSQLKLDFAGKIVETKVNHDRADSSPLTLSINDFYTYGYGDRPAIHTQKINSAAAETISSKIYNELGQLIENRIGDNTQVINYTYNIRGWLTSINNPALPGSDVFAESIAYNSPASGTPLYNGNISQVSWRTLTDNQLRRYTYTYDALNRIKTAIFKNTSNPFQDNTYNLSNVTYDKNGNITFLNRKRALADTDKMTYAYDGNILQGVKEEGNIASGFKAISAANTSVQYTYDKQGNLTSDINKSITTIEYNHLDLPKKVIFSNGSYIQYIYDAQGTKLKKTFYNGTGTTATEYNGGFIYLKSGTSPSAIQYIPTEEGYAYKNGVGTYSYAYQLKDHLGNVRVSVADVNGNHAITASEIIEESNYDPFGLKLDYNTTTQSLGNAIAQKLEYNGREFEEASLYNMNEMDWRHYDPALGRFNCIDKLTETSYSLTPYHFSSNSPIFFRDPSGLKGIQTNYGADWLGRQKYDKNGLYITPDARGNEVSFSMFNYMDGGDGYGGLGRGFGGNIYRDSFTGELYGRHMVKDEMQLIDVKGNYLDNLRISAHWENVYLDKSMKPDSNTSAVEAMLGLAIELEMPNLQKTTFRILSNGSTRFSPKFYYSGWAGGSVGRITTYNAGTVIDVVGKAAGYYSIGATGYKYMSGQIGTQEAVADATFGGIALYGGWAGAAISLSYELGKVAGPSKW